MTTTSPTALAIFSAADADGDGDASWRRQRRRRPLILSAAPGGESAGFLGSVGSKVSRGRGWIGGGACLTRLRFTISEGHRLIINQEKIRFFTFAKKI